MERVQQREGHPQGTKEGNGGPFLEEEQVSSCSVGRWKRRLGSCGHPRLWAGHGYISVGNQETLTAMPWDVLHFMKPLVDMNPHPVDEEEEERQAGDSQGNLGDK